MSQCYISHLCATYLFLLFCIYIKLFYFSLSFLVKIISILFYAEEKIIIDQLKLILKLRENPPNPPGNKFFSAISCRIFISLNFQDLSLPIQFWSLWNFKLKLLQYQLAIPTCKINLGYPQIATPCLIVAILISSLYLWKSNSDLYETLNLSSWGTN